MIANSDLPVDSKAAKSEPATMGDFGQMLSNPMQMMMCMGAMSQMMGGMHGGPCSAMTAFAKAMAGVGATATPEVNLVMTSAASSSGQQSSEVVPASTGDGAVAEVGGEAGGEGGDGGVAKKPASCDQGGSPFSKLMLSIGQGSRGPIPAIGNGKALAKGKAAAVAAAVPKEKGARQPTAGAKAAAGTAATANEARPPKAEAKAAAAKAKGTAKGKAKGKAKAMGVPPHGGLILGCSKCRFADGVSGGILKISVLFLYSLRGIGLYCVAPCVHTIHTFMAV
jgi:hypothetical protein